MIFASVLMVVIKSGIVEIGSCNLPALRCGIYEYSLYWSEECSLIFDYILFLITDYYLQAFFSKFTIDVGSMTVG